MSAESQTRVADDSTPVLELRTRLATRVILWLLIAGMIEFALLVVLAMPTGLCIFLMVVIVIDIAVLLNHALRIIQLFPDGSVRSRWLLGWKEIRFSPAAYLKPLRKRWFVYDPPHRGARLEIYPEYLDSPSDLENLRDLIPGQPSDSLQEGGPSESS